MRNDTRTKQILDVMYVLTWIAFVGLMIETGAILVSYVVSCINPEAAKNLYKNLNLEELREFSIWQYTYVVSFILAVSAMKAYVLYLLIFCPILAHISLKTPVDPVK